MRQNPVGDAFSSKRRNLVGFIRGTPVQLLSCVHPLVVINASFACKGALCIVVLN